ncbi:N-acetylneuraminate lyase B-like isoform 2-T4 [Glossina fuscipes fuscipes]
MEITKDVGKKSVTFFDFKGLMAPVFTCFNDDERKTINISYVDRYAKWLKSKNIDGVLVNGITGEGPSLGLLERKLNAECWWRAASENSLMMMLQIGGGALPDVLEMGCFAEELGIDSVCCLPEIFYKPRNIDQLIAYCKVVAKTCPSRPFFYYHIPRITNVNLDMPMFCKAAKKNIPNFAGIHFTHTDLSAACKCLSETWVLLGISSLLAAGMLLGFGAFESSILNIYPELFCDIYAAMSNNEVERAQDKQIALNAIVNRKLPKVDGFPHISGEKSWFSELNGQKLRIYVGPARISTVKLEAGRRKD